MIRVHKYIGAYERGWEHQEALRKLDEDSHLLKHVAHYHQSTPLEDIKFGMRVKNYAKTALERQVLESVLIQEERKQHNIMNRKSEYNRCSLPRLTTRIGTKEYDKERTKQAEEDKEAEKMIRDEIGRRRKEKCQNRRNEIHPEEMVEKENTRHKRRKLNDEGDYKTVLPMKKPAREQNKSEIMRGEESTKRRKVEELPKKKLLGPVLKGYELEEPINWEEERKKRMEYLKNEEKNR